MSPNPGRPQITRAMQEGKPTVLHNGIPTRVVFRANQISIGCTDITPEAARFLLQEYDKHFPAEKTVEFQPGETSQPTT